MEGEDVMVSKQEVLDALDESIAEVDPDHIPGMASEPICVLMRDAYDCSEWCPLDSDNPWENCCMEEPEEHFLFLCFAREYVRTDWDG